MGVSCNIIIPQTRGYLSAGSEVSGTIKYAVDKPTSFKQIVVSLKGHGQRLIVETTGSGKNRREVRHFVKETYVHNDIIVQDKESAISHDIGSYDTNFHFRLPDDIPPSLDYFRNYGRFKVTCIITYYVRIKFETGAFQFDKRYKKELLVQSTVNPKLGPNLEYSLNKTLFQPFRSKKSNVSIKASIGQSFLRPGQKVQVHCEIQNDMNIDITYFKSKLLEVYTFARLKNMFRDVVMEDTVRDTESKTSSIKRGDTRTTTVEIDLPLNLSSLCNSRLASRDYYVVLKLGLPMPYFNVHLKVPIEVGFIPQDFQQNPELTLEPPPSYWEAMNEYDKNDQEYD